MNNDLLQITRYKLQKRLKRLNGVSYPYFQATLKQFWTFIHAQPSLAGVLGELLQQFPDVVKHVENQISSSQVAVALDDEKENAAFSYCLLKRCLDSPAEEGMAINIGLEICTSGGRTYEHGLEAFRVAFVEPLYEYLDEQLDDQRAILSVLRRYKHKCESFQRKKLFEMWSADTLRGEDSLAFHLYEYLHDQGINLTIEPYSESGKVDMIAAQMTDDPLVADAKIFNPEKGKGKPYICHGFHQIYQYTLDYNEPFGYLVIFKTSQDDLKFSLEGQEQSVPFLTHNHKTIFLLTIDVFPHEKPASKRGYLKTIEITQADLVHTIDAVQATTDADPVSISGQTDTP